MAAMEYLPENKRSLAWQRNFSEPSAEDPEQWIQIMAKEKIKNALKRKNKEAESRMVDAFSASSF